MSHKNLPCPATKLEFVVYDIQSLQQFETISYNINLNTGREVDEHCSFDGSEDPWFWFVLDIAIGRVKGVTLWGNSPVEAFPEIPTQVIDKAMLECLEWFLANYPEDSGCFECAERCYVYIATGEMVSKTSARTYIKSLGGEVGDVRSIVVNKLKDRVQHSRQSLL